MVERRVCTFCGKEVEPGTGRMFVKKDGVTYQFCTSKCFKNMIELRRVPRRTTWTTWYAREKQVRLKGAEPEPESKKARKIRKKVKSEESETVSEEAERKAGPSDDAEPELAAEVKAEDKTERGEE